MSVNQIETEEIVHAFNKIKLHEGHRRMFQAMYAAPDETISVPDLAEAAGYKNHSGVNLQLGLLGKSICDKLGIVPEQRKQNKPIWTFGLANGERKGRFWYWTLYPEVANALNELGLVR